MTRRDRRRRGGAALVALVCLSVIAMVTAGLLRVSKSRSDQLRAIERGCQADWLVEAGLERAAARLAGDPSYGGEIWAIPAGSLGGRAAEVVIAVTPAPEGGGAPARVSVRAEYPSGGDSPDRVLRSKVFQVRPSAGDEGVPE